MPAEPRRPGTSSYGEGERVFGPPLGTYDADWVAAALTDSDPSLPGEAAQRLAARAWVELRAAGADGLAGRLADALPDLAGSADLAARTAVDYCAAYDVATG